MHAVDQNGLGVQQFAVAGRGVTGVANRNRSGQRCQRRFVEDVIDVAHLANEPHALAVGRGNAGAFLSAMLQRVEAQVGQLRRLRVSVDAEDTAFVAELIEHFFSGTPKGAPYLTSCLQSP